MGIPERHQAAFNRKMHREASAEHEADKKTAQYIPVLANAIRGVIFASGHKTQITLPDDEQEEIGIKSVTKTKRSTISGGMEKLQNITITITHTDGEQTRETFKRDRSVKGTAYTRATDAFEEAVPNYDDRDRVSFPIMASIEEVLEHEGYDVPEAYYEAKEETEERRRKERERQTKIRVTPLGEGAKCPECGHAHGLGKGFVHVIKGPPEDPNREWWMCAECGHRSQRGSKYSDERTGKRAFTALFGQMDTSDVDWSDEDAYNPEAWDSEHLERYFD